LSAVENAQKRRVILPVWHNMNQALLAEHAPMLANTLSVDTAEGITTVATQILHVVTAPGSGTPTDEATTPLRLFQQSAGHYLDPAWKPAPPIAPTAGQFTFVDLLKYAGAA
jgi:hypothetical protein